MVMETRSSYRKASDVYNNGHSLQKSNVAPPWCSLSKVQQRKRSVKVPSAETWETRSHYPLRENIWEFLYEDKRKFHKRKNGKACSKQTPVKNKGRRKIVIYLLALLGAVGAITYIWMFPNVPPTSLITSIPRNPISLLNQEDTSVDDECWSKMKHLTEELLRAEKALRSALRLRRTMMLTSQTAKIVSADRGLIQGVSVTKGEETMEYRGRAALWGVVPLWQAAPPPRVVVSGRTPVPTDCWPFSGSTGELIFDLWRESRIRAISVEHVYPDTALSAPKHFVLYGVLPNGTWITAVESKYKHNGPAKQYFPSLYTQVTMKKLVFRILSNQGNDKYTCVYRIYLYETEFDEYRFP